MVVISSIVAPGQFTLGLYRSRSEDFEPEDLARYALSGLWTAEQLALHFEPFLGAPSRYEHILAEDD
jgi:hypothetical protein